jgi:transcriptional regulator GlxA family with amidase domain
LAAVAGRAALLRLLVALTGAPTAAEPRANSPAVARAAELMRQTVASPVPVPQLARQVGLSTTHFHRQFKAEIGVAPGSFYLWQRLAHARRLLRTSGSSIVEVALACGFTSSQYFATCFQRHCGQTPSDFRAAQLRAGPRPQ